MIYNVLYNNDISNKNELCLIKITFISHSIGEVFALYLVQFAETSFQDLFGHF
jgi:hypothetical protein